MKLEKIIKLTATLTCQTGLHIGGSDQTMHIGGIDTPVIKNPLTLEPYIPGSSLKGKMRSLLEWRSGKVQEKPLDYNCYKKLLDNKNSSKESSTSKDKNSSNEASDVLNILKLFGISGDSKLDVETVKEIGLGRLSFWDCNIKQEWIKSIRDNNQTLTEAKTENIINRISGKADSPRQIERVIAGTPFDFNLSIKVFDTDEEKDLIKMFFCAMKLLELDSLGGSGSRGYGKVKFTEVKLDNEDNQENFDKESAF